MKIFRICHIIFPKSHETEIVEDRKGIGKMSQESIFQQHTILHYLGMTALMSSINSCKENLLSRSIAFSVL